MKNKLRLNFGKHEEKNEFELEEDFSNESTYLDYDEKEDKVKSLGPVKKHENSNDEFDLTDYIKEEEEKAEKLPFEQEDDNHQNKAKPIIIISFVFSLLIIIIVALILLVFNKKDTDSNKESNNSTTNTTIKTDDEENIDNINTNTKDMYGDGYFKVFNKNAKYYSAQDTAIILQNANATIKEYFKLVKKIENDRLSSINRKQEIENLENMITNEYATLEESQKVFNRYDSGDELYNCIYQRFTNVEKLLSNVKYLSAGNESVNRINKFIETENDLLQNMTKLTITFAEKNHLEYKTTDNEITIVE